MISTGAPGRPPGRFAYSGTPTQVKSIAASGSPSERGDLGVVEGHARRAGAERVGGQVQPALDEPGPQLRRPVPTVVEPADVGARQHDERRVAAEVLVEAEPGELVAQVAGAQRCVERRATGTAPARCRRRRARPRTAGRRCRAWRRPSRTRASRGEGARPVHPPGRPAPQDHLVERAGGGTAATSRSSTAPGRARGNPGPGRRPRAAWRGTSGNSTNVGSGTPSAAGAAARPSPVAGLERDHRERELVQAVGADQLPTRRRPGTPGAAARADPAETASAWFCASIVQASQYRCGSPARRTASSCATARPSRRAS